MLQTGLNKVDSKSTENDSSENNSELSENEKIIQRKQSRRGTIYLIILLPLFIFSIGIPTIIIQFLSKGDLGISFAYGTVIGLIISTVIFIIIVINELSIQKSIKKRNLTNIIITNETVSNENKKSKLNNNEEIGLYEMPIFVI